MDSDEIANVLNTFARWPRSFTFEELLDFVDPAINNEALRSALLSDSRFMRLAPELLNERHFISKITLFRWFSSLNLRLAQIRKFRLDEYQLALTMSCLRHDGRWNILPAQAVQFGQCLGLMGSAWTPGQYVFPLAWVLSFLSPPLSKVASSVLEDFAEMLRPNIPFERLQQDSLRVLHESFEEALSRSKVNEKEIYIVRAREGLLTGTKMTLKQLGICLRLSKERIRQLEAKFWDNLVGCRPREPAVRRWLLERLQSRGPDKPLGPQLSEASVCPLHQIKMAYGKTVTVPSEAFVRPLLTALLCNIMKRQGSLIIRTDSPEVPLRMFIAEATGIPQVELSHIGLAVMAALPTDFAILESPNWFPDEINAATIATRLESASQIALIDRDVKVLAESVAQFRRKHLNKAQRVYLALRAIRKPAHYSEITEVYNSLFPDQPATDRSVHTVLGREEHSVVWIGCRGMFALKEWGCERPSKILFETVAEIVQKKYTETGKPVPFTVIAAEIGKYRMVVKTSSLVFAAHFNPALRRISKDSFIPKGPNDQVQDEISADELDKILQEFQKRSGVGERS